MSQVNPAQAQASEPDSDIPFEHAMLKQVLDTLEDGDYDNSSITVNNLCANCKHPPKTESCLRCHSTDYSSVECQKPLIFITLHVL